MSVTDDLDLSADAGLLNPAWAGRTLARATADRALASGRLAPQAAETLLEQLADDGV